ncbi:MAG: (d)CMP kinase [Phycisphaerales bacterium]
MDAPSPTPHTTNPAPSRDRLIITIDGPAGTGKSSVARSLAARLGLEFLDTGAMYRAAAALALDARLTPADVAPVCALLAAADLHFDWTRDPPEILANNRSLAARIRDADVTALVSPLAGIAELREHMVRKQRLIGAQHPRLVAEGRDQGSVVFPDADVKFYLDADPRVRAARRADQLRASGAPGEIQEDALLAEIIQRDRSDRSRPVGPLVQPRDALVVDTSALTFDQVVDRLEHLVRSRTPGRLRP